MSLHRAVILSGLQELSNSLESSALSTLVFEANEGEHWLQCTPTRLHLDWPFASAPSESAQLKACFGQGLRIESWEPDNYVTIFPSCKEVVTLVAGIEATFRELYGLGPEYALSYEIHEQPEASPKKQSFPPMPGRPGRGRK